METKADRLNYDDPQPLRPLRRSTTTLLASNHRVPSSPFKKGDIAARTSKLVLGFPPAHSGRRTQIATTPFRKDDATQRRHRVGVGQANKDFSRITMSAIPNDPMHRSPRGRGLAATKLTTRQHAPPQLPSHHRRLPEATVTRPAVRRQRKLIPGKVGIAAAREGTTSTVETVVDRT